MASDDCALYDEEIQEILDRAQQLLRSSDQDGAVQAGDYLDRRSKVKNLIHQLKIATRNLETETERKAYAAKLTQHTQRLATLRKDIQLQTPAASASESEGGARRNRGSTPYGAVDDEPRGDGRDEARATAKRIGSIQKKTIGHLEQGLLTIHAAEDEGNQAAQRLGEQTRQLEENNKKLDEIDGQVKKAKSELNAFIRRMMTDKIILCLAILVVVGIIAVVAVKLSGVDNDDKKDAPAPTTSPTPTPTPAGKQQARPQVVQSVARSHHTTHNAASFSLRAALRQTSPPVVPQPPVVKRR